ncbi:hypothetical protein Agabi119p4_1981 [Agaricus bisporus var. burnettii]|uniref:MARVEL domain-containing protein n=1 Tax=Agaricus bisporus var. burnettii TaxID=192524 RepID=A0A8H7F8D5_AGABI|nr:hypothetical protein Agabi119p4_1981 [Agaricus bisporus var. burnettii]
MVFSAIFSIALWYELSVNAQVTEGIKAAFIVGGIVETLLFVASVFGLVGAIVRKLVFIRIYANITYVHFCLNLGIAIWFLVVVFRESSAANKVLCDDSGGAEQQCMQLIGFGKNAFLVVAALVLIFEIYGALIVTRYVNQLGRDKNYNRQTRRGLEEAFRLEAARYSTLSNSQDPEPAGWYDGYEGTAYDPYREVPTRQPDARSPTPRRFETFKDNGRPSPPVEVGYGGGTWTHEEISEEEKARLRRQEREREISPPLDEAERRAEIKGVGNSTPLVDEPPLYSYRV